MTQTLNNSFQFKLKKQILINACLFISIKTLMFFLPKAVTANTNSENIQNLTEECTYYVQQLKDYQGALEYCTKAINIAPNSQEVVPAYALRGGVYSVLFMPQEMFQDIQKVIALDPEDTQQARASVHLGLVNYYSNFYPNKELAMQEHEKVLFFAERMDRRDVANQLINSSWYTINNRWLQQEDDEYLRREEDEYWQQQNEQEFQRQREASDWHCGDSC